MGLSMALYTIKSRVLQFLKCFSLDIYYYIQCILKTNIDYLFIQTRIITYYNLKCKLYLNIYIKLNDQFWSDYPINLL